MSLNIGLLIIAVLLISMSLSMKTENLISSFLFKIIPFFSGAFLVFYYLKEIGVIK